MNEVIVFTLDPNATTPVYVTEMSVWEREGYPDPVSDTKCDPSCIVLKPYRALEGDVTYWTTVSNVSGAFMRIYNV